MSYSHHRHSVLVFINSCSWEHKRFWLSYHKRQSKFLCTSEVAIWGPDRGWSQKTITVLSSFLPQNFKNKCSNKFSLKHLQNIELSNVNVWTGKRWSFQTSIKQTKIYLSIFDSVWFLKLKQLIQIEAISGSFTCFWQVENTAPSWKWLFSMHSPCRHRSYLLIFDFECGQSRL